MKMVPLWKALETGFQYQLISMALLSVITKMRHSKELASGFQYQSTLMALWSV